MDTRALQPGSWSLHRKLTSQYAMLREKAYHELRRISHPKEYEMCQDEDDETGRADSDDAASPKCVVGA